MTAAPGAQLRPGEYLLLDTTRLDVFAIDPVALRRLNRAGNVDY